MPIYYPPTTGGESAPINYLIVTADYTAVAGDKIAADTTTAAFTITLPATPTDGDVVEISPAITPLPYHLTIARNGNNINGAATNWVFQNSMPGVLLTFRAGYGWRISAQTLTLDSSGGISMSGLVGQNDKFFAGGVTMQGGYVSDITRLFVGAARLTANSDRLLIDNNGSGQPFGIGNLTTAQFKNITTPDAIASSALIYAKDVAGTSKMFVMDSDGVEGQVVSKDSSGNIHIGGLVIGAASIAGTEYGALSIPLFAFGTGGFSFYGSTGVRNTIECNGTGRFVFNSGGGEGFEFNNGPVKASALKVGSTGTTHTKIKSGVATLVAGTVTVTDADVLNTGTAATSSRILVTRMDDGGTIGSSYSVTRVNGTSFTITSKEAGATQTLDTSTVSWMLVNP